MRHLLLPALLAVATAPAAAQVIPIRTVPIVQADGLEILPSRHLGMGGVSIALPDTLGDLSENPATGARLTGALVFGSPMLYSVSDDAGAGRALPLGALGRSGAWFAAGALALQAVETAPRPGGSLSFGGPDFRRGGEDEDTDRTRGSAYGFAMLGRSWSGSGLAVGGSVLAARRKAVDGIGLLYGESEGVEPFGHLAVLRVGVLKEWPGARSLEAVAVHSRTRMTHDVTYVDRFWDPDQQQPVSEQRQERNEDEADVWGLHVVHARPLGSGWRIGWLLTGNRIWYPSVPRYDVPKDGIMNIGSGRGEAHAYNLGIGLATTETPLRLGIDVVYEPIWSRVWGVAEAPTATLTGDTIPVGGRIVENRLRFSNALLRLGGRREWRLDRGDAVDVQFGVATRLVNYRLAQFDHRQAAGRNDDERWIEWTPTWGASLHLGGVEVRYHGSLTRGTQRPGVAAADPVPCPGICVALASLVPRPAPRDPSRLDDVSVVTQQIFVSVPIGNARRGEGEP
ncbi:MAG: hypothetical protein ACRELD_04985 [Longimicrobiales bacterium]